MNSELLGQRPGLLDNELLEMAIGLPARPSAQAASRPNAPLASGQPLGVTIGRFLDWNHAGWPLVEYCGKNVPCPVAARTAVPLAPGQRGCEVAVLFENGDPERPLIVGVIQPPLQSAPASNASIDPREQNVHNVPGQNGQGRMVLHASREIVLQCGKATITLTRAGKILIRGAYVLSRSSGVNRLKGGSVQIN